MAEMFKCLKVTIADVVSAKDEAALRSLLSDNAAEECGYHQTLEVAFDYWHFGRHAEHSFAQGMYVLSALFAAAWQVQHTVIPETDGEKKRLAQLNITDGYHQKLKSYRQQVRQAQQEAVEALYAGHYALARRQGRTQL
jgi:hypothetical protein